MENRDILNVICMLSQKNKVITLTVNGFSMLPQFHSGEKVSIKKEKEYFLGDIIAFQYEEEGILLHRIVKVDKNMYFCKGDNSFRLEVVYPSNIIGKTLDEAERNTVKFRRILECIKIRLLSVVSYGIGKKFMRSNMNMKVKKCFSYKVYKFLFL